MSISSQTMSQHHREENITKNYLTDAQIREAATVLSGKVSGAYKGIVAITRGGLMPALLFAENLTIKDIRTISVSSYGEDGQRGSLSIIYQPDLGDEGNGYLFVDDLVDSGQTLRWMRNLYPKATFAVLYAKPEGKDAADVFAVEVPQDEWLVFPWEPDWIAKS